MVNINKPMAILDRVGLEKAMELKRMKDDVVSTVELHNLFIQDDNFTNFIRPFYMIERVPNVVEFFNCSFSDVRFRFHGMTYGPLHKLSFICCSFHDCTFEYINTRKLVFEDCASYFCYFKDRYDNKMRDVELTLINSVFHCCHLPGDLFGRVRVLANKRKEDGDDQGS